jgi:creatinine amidohydrolase
MTELITTATSADERRREADVAVLPIGSFEQHGDFLPLATDTLIAAAIAQRVSVKHDLFLLPPLTISCSHEHGAFAGTVSIRSTTLALVVNDIMASVQASGIKALAIVNGHGGNYVLSNVTQEANANGHHVALFPSRHDWGVARDAAGLDSSSSEDMHAGELEVSVLLHVNPDLVRPAYQQADHPAHPRHHLLTLGIAAYSETGVIGYPSRASAAKGSALLDNLTASFAGHLALLRERADRPPVTRR